MSKLSDEVRKLMLREEGELPEANPRWMQMKIELFSKEEVFDGLARCAGYVKKAEITGETVKVFNFSKGEKAKKSKKRK